MKIQLMLNVFSIGRCYQNVMYTDQAMYPPPQLDHQYSSNLPGVEFITQEPNNIHDVVRYRDPDRVDKPSQEQLKEMTETKNRRQIQQISVVNICIFI